MFRVQIRLSAAVGRDAVEAFERWNTELIHDYREEGFTCTTTDVAMAGLIIGRLNGRGYITSMHNGYIVAEKMMTDVDAVAFQLSFNEPGFAVVIEEVSP